MSVCMFMCVVWHFLPLHVIVDLKKKKKMTSIKLASTSAYMRILENITEANSNAFQNHMF